MQFVPEFVFGATTVFLAAASYVDLRTGEIPEKITRGLVAFSLGVAAILSIWALQPIFVLQSLLSGVGFFAVGYLLFYLGEWGGGDVKLLAGIGCSLGLISAAGDSTAASAFPYYLDYFINFAIASSPYVIVYSFALGLMKKEVFSEFRSVMKNRMTLALMAVSFVPFIATSALPGFERINLIMLAVPLLAVLSFYLLVIEKVALQKTVGVDELKEEDLLAEDLVVDGRALARKRDMDGLSKEQIAEIRKLASDGRIPGSVAIKWGIRFAPVFSIAYILTCLFDNVLELLIAAVLT